MKYTYEYLNKNFNHSALKYELIKLGGTPSSKSKKQLIEEIIKIENGEFSPSTSKRGRPRLSNRSYAVEVKKPVVAVYDHDVGQKGELKIKGVFDLSVEGYGFIRVKNYSPSYSDAFVSRATIREFGLLKGDFVEGEIAYRRENELPELILVEKVNENKPNYPRSRFEELDAVYSTQVLSLMNGDEFLKELDKVISIGKGERGIACLPDQSLKMAFIKKVGHLIAKSYPSIELITILLNARPEDVTDYKNQVGGEVVATSFDQPFDQQLKTCELAINRAKRLLENGNDVFVIMDSLNDLAIFTSAEQGFGNVVNSASTMLAKRLFGVGRNTKQGSITMLATIVDSKFNDLYEKLNDIFNCASNFMITLKPSSKKGAFAEIDKENSFSSKK